MLLGAEHLHHVRVAHARQAASLLQDAIVCGLGGHAVGVQQLQRDVAVQIGVECAMHVTGRARPDRLEQDQPAPPPALRRAVVHRFVEIGDAAIQGRDVLDQPEVLDQPAIPGFGVRFELAPVDRVAIGNRAGQRVKRVGIRNAAV